MKHYIYISYNGKEGWATSPSALFWSSSFNGAYCYEDLKAAMKASSSLNVAGINHYVFKL